MNETMEETINVETIEKENFWTRFAPAAKTSLAVFGAGVIIVAVAAKLSQHNADEQ